MIADSDLLITISCRYCWRAQLDQITFFEPHQADQIFGPHQMGHLIMRSTPCPNMD